MAKMILAGAETVKNTFDTFSYDNLPEKECFFWLEKDAPQNGADFLENKDFVSALLNDPKYLVIDLYAMLPREDEISDEEFEVCLDKVKKLAELVTKHVDADNTILIGTAKSHLYILKKTVRRYVADHRPFNKRLNALEERFAELTNCRVVNVLKNYYADMLSPYGNSPVNYESFGYVAVQRKLTDILNGVGQHRYDEEDYESLLERYFYYGEQDKEYFFEMLFGEDDIFSRFISGLSIEMTKKYSKVISEMKKKNYSSLDEVANNFDFSECEELGTALKCFLSVVNKTYDMPYEAYLPLFEENFNMRYLLSYRLQKDIIFKRGIKGVGITEQNVPIYFKTFLEYKDSPDLEEKLIEVSKTVDKVSVIDMWGSCIAREAIEMDEGSVVLQNTLFRNSPLHISDPPVKIPGMYDDLEDFEGSIWRMRNVQSEFERTSIHAYDNTSAEWMVIDLYDITETVYQYEGNPFIIDLDGSLMGFFKKIKNQITVFDNLHQDFEWYKRHFDHFIDFVTKKYGKKIILVGVYWSRYFLNYLNKLTLFDETCPILQTRDAVMQELNDKNKLLYTWEKYFQEKTNCYYINIANQFVGDEFFMWGAHPVHYELAMHKEAAKIMADIIRNEPEQRIYTTYSNKTRVERMIRFLTDNELSFEIQNLFSDKWFDRYALHLGIDMLNKFKDSIIKIYDGEYSDFFDMLNRYNFDDSEKELYDALLSLNR